ncbi:lysogeny maintenance protein PflM [Pseudomonas borbori]
MTPFNYSKQPHPENCDCSVCWVKAELAKPSSPRSARCDQCRPASVQRGRILSMGLVNGVWTPLKWEPVITPAYHCAKHTPSDRPPKPPRYWVEVASIGKPVPYVPLREPFELTG